MGLGWTVLPAITVETEIAAGELNVLGGPALSACDPPVTRPRRHRSPALEVVAADIRRHRQR
ncbi:hypothetical protein ACWCPQ_28645 [Nocardia sp. NPDC001965]